MHNYLIYDCETGDVLHTVAAAGPLDVDDDVIEELIASGKLGRAAFAEVHPSRLPVPAVVGDPAMLRSPDIAAPDRTTAAARRLISPPATTTSEIR